ncbi:MAG: enoyl-CoA hydratase-related protein [Planctomycetota bacterium]|nr:enoyl-CoA hydratase-related protein [Planctomycetota bacterium]
MPAISPNIEVGCSGVLTATVQPGSTIVLGGDPDAEVFSTPSMINLMEHAARKAMAPFLSPGEESVGVDVEVKHLAGTPLGNEIKAVATVTQVDKNIVSFEIQAYDGWEKIGTGIHRRAVVEISKIAERVTHKRNSSSHRMQQPIQEQPQTAGRCLKSELARLPLDGFQMIEVKHEEKILKVILNRPEKKNAINRAMTEELAVLFEWLTQHGQGVSVVIFSGAGDSFSTGDDVSELQPEDLDSMQELSLLRGAVYRKLANLTQVTIAAVDGFALGGGFVFAAACDFRVATRNAQFGLPEVRLGWPPNYGIEILRSSLGRAKAIQWSTLGQRVNAQAAHDEGFLRKIVPRELLLKTADQLAKTISQNSPFAVAAIKKILPLEEGLSDENATQEFLGCLETEQAKKALEKYS